MASPKSNTNNAHIAGTEFVRHYYFVLEKTHELLYRIHKDSSQVTRPDKEGASMTTTTTVPAIKEKLLSLGYDKFRQIIRTVDSQEALIGNGLKGLFVLATGYFTGTTDEVRRMFTHSFLLEQKRQRGYFVLNDVFRFVDVEDNINEPSSFSKHQIGHSFETSFSSEVVKDTSNNDVSAEKVFLKEKVDRRDKESGKMGRAENGVLKTTNTSPFPAIETKSLLSPGATQSFRSNITSISLKEEESCSEGGWIVVKGSLTHNSHLQPKRRGGYVGETAT